MVDISRGHFARNRRHRRSRSAAEHRQHRRDGDAHPRRGLRQDPQQGVYVGADRHRRNRGARTAEHSGRPHDHVAAARGRDGASSWQDAGGASAADGGAGDWSSRGDRSAWRCPTAGRRVQGGRARRNREPVFQRVQEHFRDGRPRRWPGRDEIGGRRTGQEVRRERRAGPLHQRLLQQDARGRGSGTSTITICRSAATARCWKRP